MHVKCVLEAVRRKKLYVNLKKDCFLHGKCNFLGFVVSKHGVEVDSKKVKEIRKWPTPKNSSENRSFHSLTGFYRRSIRDFSSIATPLNELIKKNVKFERGQILECAFNDLKDKLRNKPLLTLLNFEIIFEIECDPSGIGLE
ncbi:hypothetical protein IC582_000762 [Cucumis melo]